MSLVRAVLRMPRQIIPRSTLARLRIAISFRPNSHGLSKSRGQLLEESPMKKVLALFVAAAIAAGSAYANCGMKSTDSGKLTSYDKETKAIVVELADGKKATYTLTPATTSKDAAGKAAKIEELVGKTVQVVSEHKKVDSVTETKAS
jgi:hypothetical protein